MKKFKTWDPNTFEKLANEIANEAMQGVSPSMKFYFQAPQELANEIRKIGSRVNTYMKSVHNKSGMSPDKRYLLRLNQKFKEIAQILLRHDQNKEEILNFIRASRTTGPIDQDKRLSDEAKIEANRIASHFVSQCRAMNIRLPEGFNSFQDFGNSKANEYNQLVMELGDTEEGRLMARRKVAPKYHPTKNKKNN